MLSELLWLFGCFYTSSLVATLAISLTIPLTMLADVLLKGVSYDLLFYLGATPMFLSFFIVALLTHWDNWDPIRDALVVCWRRCSPADGGDTTAGSTTTTSARRGDAHNDDENAALMESEASPAVTAATNA